MIIIVPIALTIAVQIVFSTKNFEEKSLKTCLVINIISFVITGLCLPVNLWSLIAFSESKELFTTNLITDSILIALFIWQIFQYRKISALRKKNVVSSIVYCDSCGTAIPKGTAYCTKCGAKNNIKCNSCGAEVSAGDEFCTKCGNKITKSEESSC